MEKRVSWPGNQPGHGFYRNSPTNYRFDRQPDFSRRKTPNFIIELRATPQTRVLNRQILNNLIRKLPFIPENPSVVDSGIIVGTLPYVEWYQTLEVMVKLWELRLTGEHCYNPFLKPKINLPSDKEELNERLKGVFLEKLNGLINGVLVQKWQKKLGFVAEQIGDNSFLLRKPNRLAVYQELYKKKKGFEDERDLILLRIDEFRNGIKCIIDYLNKEEKEFKVFNFGAKIDWGRIHYFMMRECRRFDNGLPIYGYRQQILEQISSQQVKFYYHLLVSKMITLETRIFKIDH